MKKIRLKKRRKPYILFIYIIILIMMTSLLIFKYLSKKISPPLFKYAEIETKKFSNKIINDAIAKNVTKDIKSDEIFIVKYGDDKEIKSIDFNTNKINEYLSKATNTIQKDMNNIEKGNIYEIENIDDLLKDYKKEDLKKGIIFYVSTGLFFNNPLLANLGPKIPVKISLTGDIISYISTEVEDYGINNSLLKVYINITVNEDIILPFKGQNIKMDAKIPIAIKMISGKIPQYYYGGRQSSQVVVPSNWLKNINIVSLFMR